MDPVLQLAGVTVRRGEATLIEDVDWTVEEDERWVILGPNGAGKTTLMQVASAQIHPTEGVAGILDEVLGAVDVFELRPRIGLTSAALAERIPRHELVRDVVEPKEFHEFCQFDMITVKNNDKYFRIPRRPHGLIEVWDAGTRRPITRLCVVFQDPGMPPSDEVVMKYLLAKHQPDLLWQIGVRFSPPAGRFEVAPPRRWSVD